MLYIKDTQFGFALCYKSIVLEECDSYEDALELKKDCENLPLKEVIKIFEPKLEKIV